MRSSQAIPIPENFLEWYTQQKKLGRTDKQIAKELFISTQTLHTWKHKVGWVFKQHRPNAGRKPLVDLEEILDLIDNEGYNYETTANIVGISSTAVRKRYNHALVD